MREAIRQHARSWHARPGSYRPFPVRHDPIVNAGLHGPGETGERLPRAGLRPRLLTLLAAVASLSCAVAPAGANASRPETWVGLGAGRIGNVQWSVKVARPSSSVGARDAESRRPCLLVGTERERSRFEYEKSKYRGCADRSTHLAATDAPLVITGAQASSHMEVRLTAVGMVASPTARRIELTYEDGRQVTIHLQKPSPSQEQRARLSRFRYAAFAVKGPWNVAHLRTESASGRTLWESDEGPSNE